MLNWYWEKKQGEFMTNNEVYSALQLIIKDHERKESVLKVVLTCLKYKDETGDDIDIKGLIKDIEKVLK